MHEHDTIHVSLICSNSLAGEGLKRILDEKDFSVIHSFKNCRAVLSSTELEQRPEEAKLLLIDASAATDLGEELVALNDKFPDSRMILLSDSFEFTNLIAAFRAGADGYLLKEIGCEALLESLRLVAIGEKVMPSQLIDFLPMDGFAQSDQREVEHELSSLLSDREIETLRCLVMGYPNKVIAHRLDISEATVKVHVKAILRKLMVQNRTQAAIWAVNHGIDANAVCATVAASARPATSAFPQFADGAMNVQELAS